MISEITSHIWELVATGAIGIGIYFFQKYNSGIEDKINSFISDVTDLTEKAERKQQRLETALSDHSTNMGKATKAINGDMLEIKKSVFTLRKEIALEIKVLKDEASIVSREFESLRSRMEITVEKFDQRYGDLIKLKNEVEENLGKIIVVGRTAKENKEDIIATKRVLAKFAKELGVIKKGKG